MISRAVELVDPSRTYLVTGGAGFIGSHLVETLLAAGARVRVLDDFSSGKQENLDQALRSAAHHAGKTPRELESRLELVIGSVVDLDLCRKVVNGVSVVFHEAAIPSVPKSVKKPLPTHAAGATGTLNMLVAAKDAGVDRLVYAGSSSAYGDTPTLPKVETMLPRPRSPYAVSKLAGEHYCAAFAASYGFFAVTLRYFNVFGPRQDPHSPYSGVIAAFAKAALEGRDATIYGDGEQTRDFTYVGNAVQANLRAAHTAPAESAGQVYNVGVGERTSVNQLWDAIREVLDVRDLGTEYGPPREGDVRDSLADLTAIREDLGYEVETSFLEGVRATCAWYRDSLT